DEAANYPLPSLPSLMSDGGGSGITTTVVLQSLAQARAVWGDHSAAAIWDAAIDKVVLGGGSTARDLDELSRLIGSTREPVHSHTTGADGHRTTSTSTVDVPILDPSALRTLPFGTGILLLREAPPIALTLRPWTARKEAAALRRSRVELEEAIRRANTR
ncbi:type IV secretory system conjugative DNA transfer family protein, partial [Intrasporangium chromatireducens]|uniref:type IV secretory system conjugative DNA transfer family protein n=1 Tax=Intrasporangium chromatireducens TaxID=1386088 RepID=UPI00054E2017